MSRIFSKNEPLICAQKFKEMYLFGVSLKDNDGNILPDSTVESFINIAIDYVEFTLNCPIFPTDMEEAVDYQFQNYRQFVYIQVPIYPIVKDSVTLVRLNFADNIGINFPPEWYKTYEVSGQIQLLPSVAALTHVMIAQAGQLLPRAITSSYAPQLLKVVYKAGLADIEGKVPPLVNQAVGLYAALYLLQMLGDISPNGTPGINSKSLSIDGMSQATSSNLSVTNNIYGATFMNYKNQLDKIILPALKRKFKRLNLEMI